MSRAPLPEVRGSRIAGLIERERALLLLRKQHARHVQLSFGEALIVTREGEGVQSEKGESEMAKQSVNNAVVTEQLVVPISALRPCALQPETRTGNVADGEFAANIRAFADKITAEGGICSPPVVVPAGGGYFTTADGHRRIAAAVLMGNTHITVNVRRDKTAEVLWAELNRGSKRITGAMWFATWAKCKGDRDEWLSHIPKSIAVNVRSIAAMIGKRAAVSLGEEEWCDPQYATWARTLHGHLERHTKGGFPDMADIFRWMLVERGKRSWQVRQWSATCRNDKHSAAKFVTAIRRGNDFPPERWTTKG